MATQETGLSHTDKRRGASRTTILVPERILPPEGSARRRPWGALLAGPLVLIALATVVALSLGMIAPGHPSPRLSGTVALAQARPPIAAPDVILPRSPQSVLLPGPPRGEADETRERVAPPDPPADREARVLFAPIMKSRADISGRRDDPIPPVAAAHPSMISPGVTARRASKARGAEPLDGPLENLVQPTDYPPSARERGEQGDVTVRLAVDPAGRVSDCLVLASDASAALARATCRILAGRARFDPARDDTGTASFGEVIQHIAWRRP